MAVVLAACGGGGGSDNADSSVTYTGNTSLAVLSSTNSGEVVSGVLTAAELSTDAPIGVEVTDAGISGDNRLVGFSEALRGILRRHAATFGGGSATGVVHSDSGTYDCRHGGRVSISGAIEDANGQYSGTASFSNCVEGYSRSNVPQVLNGHITVSGYFDGVLPADFNSNPVNDSNWRVRTVQVSGYVSIAEGARTLAFSGPYGAAYGYVGGELRTAALSADIDIRAGDVYFRTRGYHVNVVYASGNSGYDVSISGEFCHSVHGCVTVVTDTAFHFGGIDTWPSSGELTVTGAAGANARLKAISNTQYELSLDVDPADGAYETTTPGSWSSL